MLKRFSELIIRTLYIPIYAAALLGLAMVVTPASASEGWGGIEKVDGFIGGGGDVLTASITGLGSINQEATAGSADYGSATTSPEPQDLLLNKDLSAIVDGGSAGLYWPPGSLDLAGVNAHLGSAGGPGVGGEKVGRIIA